MKRDPNHTTINFDRLSIRCEKCREWIDGTVHLTGSDAEIQAWCVECCPCKPLENGKMTGSSELGMEALQADSVKRGAQFTEKYSECEPPAERVEVPVGISGEQGGLFG